MLEITRPILQGEYKIHKLLDDQGCVRVFLASRVQDAKKQYAIKEIEVSSKNLDDKVAQLARFQSVVEPYLHLDHPHAARLCDFFPEGKYEYLVFEFVPGCQIAEVLKIRTRPFTETQVLEMALALSRGLIYLHGSRPARYMADFAPSNVVVTHNASFKLTNYGLGKVLAKRDGSHPMRSTLGYAPPEQFGAGAVVNERTEVYGLGALMFHMLTLQHPASFEGILPAVRKLNPDVSPALEAFLTQALENDPVHRLPDMRAVSTMLKPMLPSAGVESDKSRPGAVSSLFKIVFGSNNHPRG